MTASSFASVSLDPALILVSLEKNSKTRELILRSGSFGVNVLAQSQEDIARSFALRGDKDFSDWAHHIHTSGALFLDGALAAMACRTHQVVEGGDHDVFIAEVIATEAASGAPLMYYDGGYRTLDEGPATT
jgi:flavin reductase (DIM6/NTAB) family NADH-FMN oxidoreductase RutF